MIKANGRRVAVDVRALLTELRLGPPDAERPATIRVRLIFPTPWRRSSYYAADVVLGDGSPVTQLKVALADLEQRTGLRFESSEAVDLTRQFLAHAQSAGYCIKGFPPVT